MLLNYLIAATLFAVNLYGAPPPFQDRNVIEGMVTAGDRPVSEVRVFLKNDGYAQIAQTYTDSSGRFRFGRLASGNYYVEVDPVGTDYERQTQRVEAQPFSGRGSGAAEVFRVTFQLVPRKSERNAAELAAARARGTVFYQEVPKPAELELEQAIRSFKEDAFESGAAALKRALGIFPDYYDALVLLGTAYVNRDDFEAAVPLLKRAVEVNKGGWLAFYSLGVAQVKLNQHAEGTAALRSAVALNPRSAEAALDLGKALAKDAATEAEAIEVLKRVAQERGKGVREAYFILASLYGRRSLYRESADALEAYMKSFGPKEIPAEQRENYKKAIERLREKAAKAGGSK
ncbi:MAG TPA: carboxypeptidase regulatory-like domain-containing protein [Pyrinomonadaceae bacterium]|jgi:tetratricopeptide (TPR) repeat protein